jgi:hypothetical protein
VNVLVTIGFIAVVAMWALAVLNRLVRLRSQVKEAWKLLETDPGKVAAVKVYNSRVTLYNDALDAFPASLIAPIAGFKPARAFAPKSETRNPKSEN